MQRYAGVPAVTAARVTGSIGMRAIAATLLFVGLLLFPSPGRAGIAAGGVVAIETSGDNGLWLGLTGSWWSEGFLGADVDLRFGKDRGDFVVQLLPWFVAFKSVGALSPYVGLAPAIVDVDGSYSFQTDSLYLKGGTRWHRGKYNLIAQAVLPIGKVAPGGLPLGLEIGCEFQFGGRSERPATVPTTPAAKPKTLNKTPKANR